MFVKMNKRGIFLPLFVIITALILSVLFYTVKTAVDEKQDLIGLRATNLVKLYDETEKINIYLDLSAQYSSDKSARILAENGGYAENNRCEKTQDGYVIWNTCPVLNPSLEFETQFKKELKFYVDKYNSSYKNRDYKKSFEMEHNETLNYNNIYTESVRNSNIISYAFCVDIVII